MTTSSRDALIADIGGTNVRFALTRGRGHGHHDTRDYHCADFANPAEAVLTYLSEVRPAEPPSVAAFCVACPVQGDEIALTNNPWRFSIDGTRRTLGLDRLEVVNDFVANALACPRLTSGDVTAIGGGTARPRSPIAAIGPGTGLGVALLVPGGHGRWLPVATEGGHVTLPALSDREAAVIALARTEVGHVSGERLVCGPGLAYLHDLLRRLDGQPPLALEPAEVTSRAVAGSDAHCVEALEMLCAMLGTLAGNLALTSGAQGGLYIMGGIAPRIVPFLKGSAFRSRFEAKGRFENYLKAVPTLVVTHPYAAFLGLEGLVG